MKSYLVDTNVFLRFVLKDDIPLFIEASHLFENASKGKVQLFASNIVLFEISFVLKSVYKLSREEIIENLETILSSPYIEWVEQNNLQTALAIYATHPSLSLVDCYLHVKAKAIKAELFTFDKNLKKLL